MYEKLKGKILSLEWMERSIIEGAWHIPELKFRDVIGSPLGKRVASKAIVEG